MRRIYQFDGLSSGVLSVGEPALTTIGDEAPGLPGTRRLFPLLAIVAGLLVAPMVLAGIPDAKLRDSGAKTIWLGCLGGSSRFTDLTDHITISPSEGAIIFGSKREPPTAPSRPRDPAAPGPLGRLGADSDMGAAGNAARAAEIRRRLAAGQKPSQLVAWLNDLGFVGTAATLCPGDRIRVGALGRAAVQLANEAETPIRLDEGTTLIFPGKTASAMLATSSVYRANLSTSGIYLREDLVERKRQMDRLFGRIFLWRISVSY